MDSNKENELTKTDLRKLSRLEKTNKKRILTAIKTNDVQTLKENLKDPVGYQIEGKTILLVAVAKGSCDVMKFLIDSGCDVRAVDKNGNNVWHHLLGWYEQLECFYNHFDNLTCDRCITKSHQLDNLDILSAAYSDKIELYNDIFSNGNKSKVTPFLFACKLQSDSIIIRLLSLIDNQSISIDHFIGCGGNNVFHFLLDKTAYYSIVPPTRLDTIRTMIEKIPFSDQLIAANNKSGNAPIYFFFFSHGDQNNLLVAELAQILFNCGVSPDCVDRRGNTLLDSAILTGNVSLVDVLLRSGCRTDVNTLVDGYNLESSLFNVLKWHWQNPRPFHFRVLELFLSFGYNLQKELFLYTVQERPIELTFPLTCTYATVYDTSRMNDDILEQLREVRRSNKLLSLQRQCRNAFRRHFKSKADEVIRNLDCVPPKIKSFLLVENEEALLQVSEL